MPDELLQPRFDRESLDRWSGRLAAHLQERGAAMAAIARTRLQTNVAPAELVQRLALAVAHSLQTAPVARLCAEGGATAAAVARALGWTRFAADRQIAGGVVALRPNAAPRTEFVIKVGSYDWPEVIWAQDQAARPLNWASSK